MGQRDLSSIGSYKAFTFSCLILGVLRFFSRFCSFSSQRRCFSGSSSYVNQKSIIRINRYKEMPLLIYTYGYLKNTLLLLPPLLLPSRRGRFSPGCMRLLHKQLFDFHAVFLRLCFSLCTRIKPLILTKNVMLVNC